MQILGFVASSYVAGLVLGMPVGLGLAIVLSRRLTSLSVRAGDLEIASRDDVSEELIAATHLRRTSRAIIAVSCALACGAGGAIFEQWSGYSPGAIGVFALWASAASFWEFRWWLGFPATIGFFVVRWML